MLSEKYLKLLIRIVDPIIKIIENYGFQEASLAIKKIIFKDKILSSQPKYNMWFGDLLLDRGDMDPELGYIGIQTQ